MAHDGLNGKYRCQNTACHQGPKDGSGAVHQAHRMKGLYTGDSLTLGVLLDTGQVCHY
jgi:hypothetical protein